MFKTYRQRLGKERALSKFPATASPAPPREEPLLHHQEMKGPSNKQKKKHPHLAIQIK